MKVITRDNRLLCSVLKNLGYTKMLIEPGKVTLTTPHMEIVFKWISGGTYIPSVNGMVLKPHHIAEVPRILQDYDPQWKA